MNNMNNVIFYPKYKKNAYIFLLLPILISCFILIYAISYLLINKPPNWYRIIITIALCLLIIVLFLHDLLIYKTMRYEFKDDGLYLICGKYNDKIDYNDIDGWENKNLTFNPLASTRMPGFSLGDCYYSSEGTVRMYATSGGKDILLIKTKGIKYGITPEKIDDFILELEKRVKE